MEFSSVLPGELKQVWHCCCLRCQNEVEIHAEAPLEILEALEEMGWEQQTLDGNWLCGECLSSKKGGVN